MEPMLFQKFINSLQLILGIGSGLLAVLLIKREPRRIVNGILLVLSLFFCLVGGIKLYNPDVYLPDGTIELHGSDLLFAAWLLSGVLSIIVGIALCMNGALVLRRERKSLSNALPIFFGLSAISWPFLILIMLLFSISFEANVSAEMFLRKLSLILMWITAYIPGMLLAFLLYACIYALLPKKLDCDFILVLGAGLTNGVMVTPLLAGRLNKAIDIFKKTKKARFVVSGGQGADELISEAYAMKQYLVEKGIPEADILLEDQSKSTYENMKFSKALMSAQQPSYSCIFVTSDYHVLRAAIQAKSLGLNMHGVGSRTARYYLPAAFIREYIAVIFKYKHLAILYIGTIIVLNLMFKGLP